MVRPDITSASALAAIANHVIRLCRRCASRRTRSSSLSPVRPAISFSFASRLPSPCGRKSAAIGSAGTLLTPPSASTRNRNAGGKHSSAPPEASVALGSPATMTTRSCASPRNCLKLRTSSFTQRDRAAAGDAMTIRNCAAASASRRRPSAGCSRSARATTSAAI